MNKPHCNQAVFTSVYLLLILATMMLSWVFSAYEIRFMNRNSDMIVNNLLDYQGLRWFFRNVSICVSESPAGNVILLMMGCGLFHGSGLQNTVRALLTDRASVSYRQRYSLIVSSIPLALYLILVSYGLFGGHRVLLGISGCIHGSPFLMAAFFLLFLFLAIPSVAYGLASGAFRQGADVMDRLCSCMVLAVPYLVTLYVASLLVACLSYSGIAELAGLGEKGFKVLSAVIFWLPLLCSRCIW